MIGKEMSEIRSSHDSRDKLDVKRALMTVYDKTGIAELAISLVQRGVEIIATGGTLSTLEKAGVKITPLEKVGKFPEMLEGRVKTLQPEIFAGILARKSKREHMDQISSFGVKPIDIVVCNFYAFEATAQKHGIEDQELIEMIDIGGPSLIRAAAKNYESVCAVPSPQYYDKILNEIDLKGGISYETRQRMAIKSFEIVAAYDAAICNTLSARLSREAGFPDSFLLSARMYETPKYGENPDQKAMIYAINGSRGGIPDWTQLFGDIRSYNNHLDVASSFEILEGFEDYPAAATVKHGQISGFAFSNKGLADAYRLAHLCDPEADFGNTTVLNRQMDMETAELVGRNEGVDDDSVYTEIVLAPGYDPEALEILKSKQKKKMRLIKTTQGSSYSYDVKVMQGLVLVQQLPDYRHKLDASKVTLETEAVASKNDKAILLGLWEVARRVESNAIVVGNGEVVSEKLEKLWTLGVGSFRKRNGATKIALDNAAERASGAYCASDGFFPFPDSVEMLGKAGIGGIIQPGGSISDRKVIETANFYSIPMLFTHQRAFKH